MDPDVVPTVRRFNRSHSRRSGTLAASFLGTGRPYGQSRLLFEIGHEGATTLELRTRLGLDSGYLSRLLRRLEAESLVLLEPDPNDGRRRMVHLSPAGRAAWADLETRSDAWAANMVDGLTDSQQAALVAALRRADRLLAVPEIEFTVVDPQSPAAATALTAYFGELDDRFVDGFDVGDALDEEAAAMRPPHGAFVVATFDDDPVGCGGVQRIDPATGEIKRMWVDADWRGMGLGRRLLTRLETEALELHHTRVVLDTNQTLTEAIRMYERAGYQAIERYNANPYAHHWFAKPLEF